MLLFKTVYLHRTVFDLGIFLSEEDYSNKYTPLSDLNCSSDDFLDVCPYVQIPDAI